MKKDEFGGAYGICRRDEKCIKNFGRKTWREEAIWKN
jgi:hypothetical protein